MGTNDKTYPSWIKYFLEITAWLGLIKSFVTLLTNLSLYGAQVAFFVFIGNIILFMGVMLIISKKFWGYILYCFIIISQFPLSYYMYGNVSDTVYPAIFVRLIVMSILVFVPFKRGHSLFAAMKPIKLFISQHNRVIPSQGTVADIALVDNDIAETNDDNSSKDIIYENANDSIIIKQPCSEVSDVNLSNGSSTDNSNFKKDNYIKSSLAKIIQSKNIKKLLMAIVSILIIAIVVTIVFNHNHLFSSNAYYIDDSNMLHCDANCRSIDGTIELILPKFAYENAAKPENVLHHNYKFHFCGKCFDINKMDNFRDSVSLYVCQIWGTNNIDTLTQLSKEILWFHENRRYEYHWSNSNDCLRYFKNPNNALNYYIKECNNLNLGTPQEYVSLFATIFNTPVLETDITVLANKKIVYDFLDEHNYRMEPFNVYLEHIAQPQRRERLYNTLVSENAHYAIPLENYNEFQTWLGF